MKVARHAIIVCIALLLLLGVPVYATGFPQRELSGIDALSSPTVIIEQPSGAYVVLINKDMHNNKENLDIWKDFFCGEEIGFLFEDISCVVADIDEGGLELARSFQSRLPENQMGLRTEDITLMLSKLEYGRFDVALMSREIYEAYGVKGMNLGDGVVIIEATGV